MPHYDYECTECDCELTDVKQSINDDALTTCPECNKESLERIIFGGAAVIVKSITTLGQLADFNGKKHKSRLDEEAHRKRESAPKKEVPFYHDPKLGGATQKELNSMTPERKTRYIMEGKK